MSGTDTLEGARELDREVQLAQRRFRRGHFDREVSRLGWDGPDEYMRWAEDRQRWDLVWNPDVEHCMEQHATGVLFRTLHTLWRASLGAPR